MAALSRYWITISAVINILGLEGIKSLPNVTHSGYVDVNKADGSQIFYTYYEAQEEVTKSTPVLLWLQVRSQTGRCIALQLLLALLSNLERTTVSSLLWSPSMSCWP